MLLFERKQRVMSAPGRFNFRMNKYHKLNLVVIVIVLGILLAVFFWYERSLNKIDNEMTKQMIGKTKSHNGAEYSHSKT
jgi:hypothetical protein